jgi:predicted nucleic acid-binding protein
LSVVTLDSNIYVSALNFKGRPLQLLQNAAAGEIEVAVSDALLTKLLASCVISSGGPKIACKALNPPSEASRGM